MIALVAVLALQAQAPPAESKAQAPLEWSHHLAGAVRMALEKKSQILILFTSKTCGWCRRLEQETLRDPQVVEGLSRRVLVHLDLEEAHEIAESLGIQAVPEVRLYTFDGKPQARQTGFLPAAPFAAWLAEGARSPVEPAEPSLGSLRLDSVLDPYFDLEARGKPLPSERLVGLLVLAAGPQGETRTEGLRLVRKWAPALAGDLVGALSDPRLKVRLAAFDALTDLGAPLGKLDPWAGPAGSRSELEAWLKKRPGSAAPPAGAAAEGAAGPWTPDFERDLRAVEEGRGSEAGAARERLVAGGTSLVPRLRERSRALRGSTPAAAARLDEVRFRILLPPGVLRRVPDAASHLAVGSGGARAQALEDALQGSPRGLEPLVREAACDVEPLFREAAAGAMRGILGPQAREALVELLKDPEANVRSAALRELAGIPTNGTAEAIRDYLKGEKDPDMVESAVRSLQEVPTSTSREVLRSMLESPFWSVRGAAVKALMELLDLPSLPAIVERLKDPDEFVIGQALQAVGKLSQNVAGDDLETIVADIEKVMASHPRLTRAGLQALAAQKLRTSRRTDGVLRHFTRDPDGSVRAQALTALASDPKRPAFEEVRAGLEDPDVRVRAAAAGALRLLVETREVLALIKQSKRPEAYPDCKKALRSGLADPDATLRLESAMTLLYFGDLDEGAAVWKGFLGGRDPALRKQALAGLKWFGPEAALAGVVREDWAGGDADEHRMVLWTLASAEREVRIFPLLLGLLPGVPESQFREWSDAAVRSVLGDNSESFDPVAAPREKQFAKDLLAAAAGADLGEGRRDLLRTLAQSYDPYLGPEDYRSGLGNARAPLRRGALACLLRAGVRLEAELLEPLVRDPDAHVRALALVACMPTKERNLFEDLNQDWLGGSAVRWRYGRRNFFEPSPLVQLPEKLLNERLGDADEDVRLRAALLMTLEGSDEALSVLHRAWRAHPDYRTNGILIRGVVGAWEDAYTSILEEVSQTFAAKDEYSRRNLLEQIKPLRGERIRVLRARMLSDLGQGN